MLFGRSFTFLDIFVGQVDTWCTTHSVITHHHRKILFWCCPLYHFKISIFKYATTLFEVEKNLEKEKVVHSYSINALSCLVIHSFSNTFAKPNLVEVCMKVVKFIPRICHFLAHISRLRPNQIKVCLTRISKTLLLVVNWTDSYGAQVLTM